MRVNRCLLLFLLGTLTACTFGGSKEETYTNKAGETTVIESDRELCVHSCNDDYSRCMDSDPAQKTIEGMPPGMVGAAADCRNSLQECLPSCKGR